MSDDQKINERVATIIDFIDDDNNNRHSKFGMVAKLIKNNEICVLNKLLEHELGPSILYTSDGSLLDIACKYNNMNCFKLLLQHGANPHEIDMSGCSILHTLVQRQHLDMLMEVLDLVPNLNLYQTDICGYTILNYSVAKKDIFEFLLQHGMDINRTDVYPPLWSARGINQVKLVLSHGADPNIQLHNYKLFDIHMAINHTLLHVIPVLDNYRNTDVIIALLVKYGADINALDVHGYTPAHIAAYNKNIQMVKMLYKHGANLSIKDDNGITVISIIGEKALFNLSLVDYLLFMEHINNNLFDKNIVKNIISFIYA